MVRLIKRRDEEKTTANLEGTNDRDPIHTKHEPAGRIGLTGQNEDKGHDMPGDSIIRLLLFAHYHDGGANTK